MGGAPDIERMLEYIRTTHIPMPPPHQVILDPKIETADCDLKERVVRLNPKSQCLEWDYRHEIEHLNAYPRTEKEMFKHYVKARSKLSHGRDRELFKQYFTIIANITYDSYIDYELAQRYENVRKQMEDYVKRLPSLEIPCDEVRALVVRGRKPKWLSDDIVETMLYVFQRLKRRLPRLAPKVRIHVMPQGDPRVVGEALVELLDEGYSWDEIKEAAKEYLKDVAGKRVRWSEVVEAYIDALIRSRFNFAIKATFEPKVAIRETREAWDVWRLGDPIDELEVHESIRTYGILVPGCNTLRRSLVPVRRGIPKRSRGGARIAILADCSGSMLDYRKWIYARDAVLMLLGFANRYRYEACVGIFTNYNVWSHEWTRDHYTLARRFVKRFNPSKMPFHSYTSPVHSLEWLSSIGKENMTIYLISDMELAELHNPAELEKAFTRLAKFSPRLVLFLISHERRTVEIIARCARRANINDVKGYWVNPLEARKLVDEVIKEISV
ncbi:MAG: hypothetical protein DRN15_07315 [Thermoprotei archaeon]|nr:MAG: hypothetical protein DRN15_07315 [Thermoprotei archaeon]